MTISRAWAMPNKNTFAIEPIKHFIFDNINTGIIIDPFANSNKIANITNDLDEDYNTDYHLDALDFLNIFDENSVDCVLFDPPYSPRQVSECYKKLGKTVNMETTQSSFWSKMKDVIQRITKPEGIVFSFGWNSQGIGISRGFDIEKIMLVAHGGAHNDTICVLERKAKDNQIALF